ncbi:MAG: hypothetical protein ACI9Y7_003039 [Dokdonia sp.]|jgi:hypothetical protein
MKKDKLRLLSLNKVTISNLEKSKITGGVEAHEKTDSCRFCDPISFQNTNCCWTWWGC